MKVKYIDKNNCLWDKQLYLYENDGVVITKDSEEVFFINKGTNIFVTDFNKAIFEGYLHNNGNVYYEKFSDEEVLNMDKIGKKARKNLDTIDTNDSFMTLSNKQIEFLKGFKTHKKRNMDGNFLNIDIDLTRDKDGRIFNYNFVIDELINPSIRYDETDDKDIIKTGELLKDSLQELTGLEIEVKQKEKQKILRK